jgi:hypothetical protein
MEDVGSGEKDSVEEGLGEIVEDGIRVSIIIVSDKVSQEDRRGTIRKMNTMGFISYDS